MNIAILCTDPAHPVNAHLERWAEARRDGHTLTIHRRANELEGGDILFLVSCHEKLPIDTRRVFRWALVLHASALPAGRGWSPHIWALLEGARRITLSLIEAADPMDSGDILAQLELDIPESALWDEINELLFTAECRLMDEVIQNFDHLNPRPQSKATPATYLRKRTPEDSRIDPQRTIAEQFDLLRVSDPTRYPAFFDFRGARYRLSITRMDP